jgi:hypothetical protein
MNSNKTAVIEQSSSGLSIIVSAKRNRLALMFEAYYLVLGIGSIFFIPCLLSLEDLLLAFPAIFLYIWLSIWIIAFVCVLVLFLWGCWGKEKLEINPFEIRFEKTVFGAGIKKRLQRKHVENFTVSNPNSTENNLGYWGLGRGKIKFEYGCKTYSFGLGLEDAEAEQLVSLINEYL